jgi:ubiquinone biosynthesis monooxygenase Coq7
LKIKHISSSLFVSPDFHSRYVFLMTTEILSIHLQRELRSDHAGELGAVFIYRGMMQIAKLKNDKLLIAFATAHGLTEAKHLAAIEDYLPAAQRSMLLVPWRIAGWLTGALPALFGSHAAYATVASVETFVDQHYQQQIDHIERHGGHTRLLALLKECQADECHHRDEAANLAGHASNFFVRAWCWLVGVGSAGAVVLARRI